MGPGVASRGTKVILRMSENAPALQDIQRGEIGNPTRRPTVNITTRAKKPLLHNFSGGADVKGFAQPPRENLLPGIDLATHCQRSVGRFRRKLGLVITSLGLALLLVGEAMAQTTFAGNAQHTAIYSPTAQSLNTVHWTAPIDLNNTGAYAHYGAP